MSLKPGDKAPNFSLQDQNGNQRNSKNLKGKVLVLFFYPKDETPGCTAEACEFRDSYKAFQSLGAEVWGVSSDNEASHKNFSNRYNLPYPLLSDTKNSLRKAFKVPNKFGLIPGRLTFVIDGNGTIRSVFNNLFNGPAHVKEAMLSLKTIKGKK